MFYRCFSFLILFIIAAASSKIVKVFIVYKVNYAFISFALLFSQLLSNNSPQRKKPEHFLFYVVHQQHLWYNSDLSQLNTQDAFGSLC